MKTLKYLCGCIAKESSGNIVITHSRREDDIDLFIKIISSTGNFAYAITCEDTDDAHNYLSAFLDGIRTYKSIK